MIIALSLYFMSCASGAACGKVYAYMNEQDEIMHMVLGAVLPPIAIFYAATILMK
jgi:hypothetical protein